MTRKNILLACAGGMSSSLLAQRMQESADKNGLEAKVTAVGTKKAKEILSKEEVSVLLIGPQVRFTLTEFKKQLAHTNIPVEVINMKDYGMMNGDKVLQHAIDLIKD